MKSVFQKWLAMPLTEETSCEIEISAVSRFEPFRVVQHKVFVFIRNEFLFDRRFSGRIFGHFLSRGKVSGYQAKTKEYNGSLPPLSQTHD